MSNIANSIIYIAIGTSTLSFCLSTIDSINEHYGSILYIIEAICVAVFIVEYIVNIVLSRFKFVFSLQGILDLVVIVPFFFGTNSSFLRIFRLLRITKMLKMLKLVMALDRIKKAFSSVRQELILFSFLTGFILFFAASGIYVFEHQAQPENFSNILDGIWWAVVTLTTVGYGDVYPITIAGKLFTVLIVIAGLGIVAIPTGLIASAFTEINKKGD